MLAKKYSVFTDNLHICYFTGSNCTHLHHIFGASNRKRSEKYGYLIPLHPNLHNMSNEGVHFNREFDLKLKKKAQKHFEKHIGTRANFRKEFGKSYL